MTRINLDLVVKYRVSRPTFVSPNSSASLVIAEVSGRGRNIRPKESLEYDSPTYLMSYLLDLPIRSEDGPMISWLAHCRCRYLAHQGYLIGSPVEIEVDVTDYESIPIHPRTALITVSGPALECMAQPKSRILVAYAN